MTALHTQYDTVSFQCIRPETYILFPPSFFFLSLLLQTAYFGDTKKVVEFFKHIGLPVEPHYNPADFIRKCISILISCHVGKMYNVVIAFFSLLYL